MSRKESIAPLNKNKCQLIKQNYYLFVEHSLGVHFIVALNKESKALPKPAETLSSAIPPFLAPTRLLEEDNGCFKLNFT